ncbi:MAG TPA: nicotinate-nucleotide adenylyltransferase [Acidimicrobiales bacterium]|nr:nicotinate-nucleotide adenylyltransferase [Acidimicrobiales bacterium]
MRIGILGGTFDPVHVGHLAAAVEVRHELALDTMLLVVANLPWQKAGSRAITPAVDRLAVVAAAVDGIEGLEASALEVDRGGPSYTADTVAELAGRHPGAELFLVVGSDVVPDLPTWKRVGELQSAVTVVVVRRPGAPGATPPQPWRSVTVAVPALDVSSTDLRARVAAGRPIDALVPAAAVREIRRRGLYAG